MNSDFVSKNKGLIIAIVVIVVLIIISVNRKPEEQSSQNNSKPATEQTSTESTPGSNQPSSPTSTTPAKTTTSTTPTGSLIREGTLLVSDSASRGNYMIKTANSVFYLRTSRDFSQLVNKEVKMVANGTVEKFTLVDIIAK